MNRLSRSALLAALVLVAATPALAQSRIRSMPGYERFESVTAARQDAFRSGALEVEWAEDASSFTYFRDGRGYRYDVAAKTATPIEGEAPERGRRRGGPERGRQHEEALSPDGSLRAFYRDRNLWLSNADGSDERPVTADGSEETRVKYGTASWVYGEELDQVTAMWWSPSGGKLAYYRFDESGVPDFYLQMDQTRLQSTLDIEAYPKAGVDNPVVDLLVYDVASGESTRIDVRDGQPFTDDVVGHYVYNVTWTPDGTEILLNRTNRWQNILEIAACSPETGACRAVVRDAWPDSWVENRPEMAFLEGGRWFVLASERTGWRNYYLYDLDGTLIQTLTDHAFEVEGIELIDEEAGVLWYMARSGDNPMKLQLHRVGLDGKGDVRLTDPSLNHTISMAPNGRHFVDVAEAHDYPPVTTLWDVRGPAVAELAISDIQGMRSLGLEAPELFTFKAADGETTLYGMLSKPSDFDPSRQYPLLVSVYAGPARNGAAEIFGLPHPFAEFGFLVATLDSRSAAGRGKRFLDAIYMKLGTVEIDDQAAGVKALAERPYVDSARVGIFGTSYGGYASAMAILRHPDVFRAASAGSAVTDWRHYDTIYTERYMRSPQANPGGYDTGSAMSYVDNLKGDLLIYYGTADNNVHPNNSMQLIDALQRAGKSFDVQVGPDQGHSGVHPFRMMEFFIDSLVEGR